MSNRLKSSTNRMRCERCGRRNQRLTLQNFTAGEADDGRQTVSAILCGPCHQKLLAKLSENYELVAEHAIYTSMDRAEYKRRLRDADPPPAS